MLEYHVRMSTVTSAPRATASISYTDLYARWERGHWLATEIDFTQDRIDWQEKLSAEERHAALWFMALFFHGEDEVADDLSPYVEAAPTEEQTYFLTTQQVDEARHAVFFNRFMHEVVGLGDGSLGSGLEATKQHLTWGHRKTFENLARVSQDLKRDSSRENYARAITNYMIIVEGTMAQPGQHLLEGWVEKSGLLPGFFEGLQNVANDEQRHIAFGMKTLADMYADDPDTIGEIVIDAIRTTGTYLLAFAYPKDGDSSFLDPLGITLQQLYADSMRSLTMRLKGLGFSDEHRARALTLDPSLSFEEQGQLVMRLLDCGYVGPGDRPVSMDPDDLEVMFTMLGTLLRPHLPDDGTVVQLDFTDVGPRHYFKRGGELQYEVARHPSPSVSVRVSVPDLLDIVGERANPIMLILQRRLKVSGDKGLLVGKRSVFGPPPTASKRQIPLLSKLGLG